MGAGANGGAGIKGGAGADGAGDGAAVADASAELPADALRVVRRAASASWDGNTVILLFATADFTDLAFNWAQAARLQRLRNFVLVAMDRKLGEILSKFDKAPGLLLPRVASDAVAITKLNVIGERQRFGLRVLERGLNVLFVDLDAILLRSPEPLLRDGDIIGERIWGRPLSVVKKWGAAICTGFYFVRSNAHTIGIFQETQARIQEHRQKKPKWQSSDQWAINHALDDAHVEWESEERMRPLSDMGTKYWDNASHVGYTRSHRLRLVVLPHVAVARACPILKDGAAKPPASDIMQMRKWKLWQHLLRLVSPHLPLLSHPIFRMRHTPTLPPPSNLTTRTSSVLHCFPPNSMPCEKKAGSGEKCDKSVIMGSAVHIHGEVIFDQKQGLWFMKDGWEEALRQPSTTDFFEWLEAQYNGLTPGQAPPPPSGPVLQP